MNRIDLWRLQALLRNRNYRDIVVTASVLGGWFLPRRRAA